MKPQVIAIPDDRDAGMTLAELRDFVKAAEAQGARPNTPVRIVAGVRRSRLLKIQVTADDSAPAPFAEADLLGGEGVHPKILAVWMDGFRAGVSSALATYTNADAETSRATAFDLGHTLRSDPLAMLAVEDTIQARLEGRHVDGLDLRIAQLPDGDDE